MTLFARTLWPDTVRRPYLRLAGALLAAPLALAAVLTLVTFLIAGSTESTSEGTFQVTQNAAEIFFVTLVAFSLTFGLAGTALLWALGQRGVQAWLVTGAWAGLLVAVGHGLFVGDGIVAMQMAVAVMLGLVLFVLIRWFAGVRLS